MNDAITYTAFFGDRERSFAMTDPMLAELERVTGIGIGAIWLQLIGQTYPLSTLHEIIRLGLVGAGSAPVDAARMVETYVHNRPLAETYPLAFEIVNTRWVGKAAAAIEEVAA